MNERIKELATQAGIKLIEPTGHITAIASDAQSTQLARFAELIVRECLNLVDRGGEFVSRPKLVERIKTHFGVEE
jgi:hypothetical protein